MNASQLHVTYVDLAAIAQPGGIVLLVTVLQAPSDATGYVMRARIDEVWTAPVRDEEEDWADAVPPEPARHKPGDECEFTIYRGVEWDDPAESPTDSRVRGALSTEAVSRHDRVVVVRGPFGFELLPWSEAMARKLAVFFGDGGVQAYRDGTASAQLQADLADPDLRALARETLSSRGELTADLILLAAGRETRPFHMLLEHVESLDQEARNEFLEAAAQRLADAPDPLVMRDLIEVASRFGRDERFTRSVARLVVALAKSARTEAERSQADWIVSRHSDVLSREERVLLDERSESEFLDWLLAGTAAEREAALAVGRQMTAKRRRELLSRLLWGDRMRQDDESYRDALCSLSQMVPDAGTVLTPSLRNDRAWKAAAAALAAVGAPAVPSIEKLLAEVSSREIRARATALLERIRSSRNGPYP